jgi:hypothetical protein
MSVNRQKGVKLPADNSKLTKSQAIEMSKCLHDVEYFIRQYVKIQTPTRGAILFDLYEYQERVVQSLVKNKKNVILQPRQSGKSATIVAYLLHKVVFYPDVTIGVAAHKGDGAKEIIDRFRYAYENLPFWMKPAVKTYNVFDIVFVNGSKIMSQTTTESTYRGKSLSVLYLDEFAFVNPRIEAEFWKSILPTLSAPGTELIITSTPNTSEGKYAEIWFKAEQGLNDFNPIRVYNDEVPDRQHVNEAGEDFKTVMLKDMSPIEYAQEYECAFVSNKGTLIQSEILEAMRPSTPLRKYNGMDVYSSVRGKKIALSVDVGEGIGQDFSVIQAFDLKTFEQVAEYRNNTQTLTEFAKTLVKVLKWFKNEGARELVFSIEANSIGQGVISLILNSSDPIFNFAEFLHEPGAKRHGILTSTKTKMKGCTKFKDLVESGKLKIHSKNLISELRFFVKAGASFKAETGKTDDLAMGCVLFALMLELIANYDPDVYDALINVSFASEFDEEDEIEGGNDPLPFCF